MKEEETLTFALGGRTFLLYAEATIEVCEYPSTTENFCPVLQHRCAAVNYSGAVFFGVTVHGQDLTLLSAIHKYYCLPPHSSVLSFFPKLCAVECLKSAWLVFYMVRFASSCPQDRFLLDVKRIKCKTRWMYTCAG